MSLTSFLNQPQIKERFRKEFPNKPTINKSLPLLAQPQSKRYSLVGTAFDYLLRFYIKRLNPQAISNVWVAEHSADRLLIEDFLKQDTKCAPKYKYTSEAYKIVDDAHREYKRYVQGGKLTSKLIESTLKLAQLDVFYRTGYIDSNFGAVYDSDVRDLRKLIAIARPELFTSSKICLLNPTFGVGSILVGGADADLVIDDTLIDIKTTKHLDLERRYFNQLIGYYVLYKLGGVTIENRRKKVNLKKLGVYFSRYGHLYTFNIADVIKKNSFEKFVTWFQLESAIQNTDILAQALIF